MARADAEAYMKELAAKTGQPVSSIDQVHPNEVSKCFQKSLGAGLVEAKNFGLYQEDFYQRVQEGDGESRNLLSH